MVRFTVTARGVSTLHFIAIIRLSFATRFTGLIFILGRSIIDFSLSVLIISDFLSKRINAFSNSSGDVSGPYKRNILAPCKALFFTP